MAISDGDGLSFVQKLSQWPIIGAFFQSFDTRVPLVHRLVFFNVVYGGDKLSAAVVKLWDVDLKTISWSDFI